ncbi:ParA family protein [Jannaschia rubra]|uniref:Sporulation initiation inhibitor protein soj n=1 Tax=Jannaschia rubra TaxID=282197 RepID=A0A0M6XRN3_9RHOB|nr:AAA family ATPase [Jannaschia rubra]CTQ33740.1 Sporulation initiation inhibitor protein soj [Jannaschia rubra]SFG07831.1 Cellulose biosynthesis protein BcsQ [Jannaschia rubra]
MTERIAIFNHKGGVGKTVSAYNIGWKYTEKGKKVLLVDGDSQVNLSAMVLGTDRFDAYYEDANTRSKNIKDGVLPVFDGQPSAIEPFDCPTATNNDELFLLPGHPELSIYEGQLSLAQETAGSLSALKNLPGALSELVSEIEEYHDIDITLIDLNPGLGAINQNFLMFCSSFIVPTNPDPFSAMAVKTLGEYLTRWTNWKKMHLDRFESAEYRLPGTVPKFLGTLNSRFNKHSSKAAKKFDERIRLVDGVVKDQLFPRLQKNGMTYKKSCYKAAYEEWQAELRYDIEGIYALARIPDFQSLIHYANEDEVPVFSMDRAALSAKGLYGNALDNAVKNAESFNLIFNAIVEKIEILLDEDCSR